MGLVALRHVGSSQTRDLTRVSSIGRQTLHQWATREASQNFSVFTNWISVPFKHLLPILLPQPLAPAILLSISVDLTPLRTSCKWDPANHATFVLWLASLLSLMLLMLVAQSCPTLCNLMDCSTPGSSWPWNFLGKNTGMSCHFLLQEIFPIQGSNPGLLHCKRILYLWATREAHSEIIFI